MCERYGGSGEDGLKIGDPIAEAAKTFVVLSSRIEFQI
jgi:hypothetical protein